MSDDHEHDDDPGATDALDRGALDEAPTLALESDGDAARPGQIGPWELTHELGRGGMGRVYLAVRADDEFRRQVAIKIVRSDRENETIVRRFRSERQILARLDHPNIARLLDGGTTRHGLPYFVMEYVRGRPIDEYCDRENLAVTARLALFLDVCSAVSYAHQQLIVHRDIKPRNILVTGEGVPKLLDFGIAKILAADPSEIHELTGTGVRLMTPEYASPEQVRGEPITTATDVYLLGLLLYELLSGHRPYRFRTHQATEIERVVCEVDAEPPSIAIQRPLGDGATSAEVWRSREGSPARLRRRLAGDLDTIVQMALRKEPRRRYASVQLLADDIRRHLENRPVVARRPTPYYRVSRFVRRHRTAAAAGVLVVLSLAGGLWATAREARIAQRRFDDVRRLANAFLFDFHDAVESLPGSTSARELVVRKGLEYLDSLSREAGADPELRRELATAYQKVGDVQGRPNTSNLGDTAGALQSQRKALALRQQLAAEQPGRTELKLELAISHDHMAELMEETGALADAVDHYGQALAIRQAVGGPAVALAVGRSHTNVGSVIGAMGRTAEGLDHFRAALRIADGGSGLEADRLRTTTWLRMGDLQTAAGDAAGAADSYRRLLELSLQLAQQHPLDAFVQRTLSSAWEKVGDARGAKGDVKGALDAYREENAIDDRLARADPLNAHARRDLAFSHTKLGETLQQLGQGREAETQFREALAIRERLSANDPVSAKLQRDLAISYERIGVLLMERGDTAGADALHRKALGIRLKQAAAEPRNALAHFVVAVSYSQLGDNAALVAEAKGTPRADRRRAWTDACGFYRQSLDVLAAMKRDGLLSEGWAGAPGEIGEALRKCESALARL